jgi:hypothetical protein
MTRREDQWGRRGRLIRHSEGTGRTVTIVGIIVKMHVLAGASGTVSGADLCDDEVVKPRAVTDTCSRVITVPVDKKPTLVRVV